MADSSPLIGLCRIGQVQLLQEVFGRVVVLGVLIAAKRRGIRLDAVALARELQRNGIWLAEDLVAEIERA